MTVELAGDSTIGLHIEPHGAALLRFTKKQ
jgi:hypothetical protein